MFENVSIIIPFQTDNGPREAAFKWLVKYYSIVMPKAEIVIGTINENDVNKAKAVNMAAKKATRDIFVILDADIVVTREIIEESIKLLDKAAWVVPFTKIYDVPYELTRNLLKTEPTGPIDINKEKCNKVNWLYNGFAGKINIIPRKNFEAVGGFDERFIGWGGEDDAFSHAVNTICGYFVNYKGSIFHLWHPSSSYHSNPNSKANIALLNRYIEASGNKEETMRIISERYQQQSLIKQTEITRNPKSKICFSILVHKNRDLVKQLIDNVKYYCPNSSIVLFNGGKDPHLCDGLDVPVCPTSRKLERGYTTIYFLETMEWMEELGIEYEYFINLDSDSLFFRHGYEEFVQAQMQGIDYMAVKLRVPESDWYIGKELKKDLSRWKELFDVNPFLGIFNVGQIMRRSFVRALLQSDTNEKLKKALQETISFGTDEFLFVNMAVKLGLRVKRYPNQTDSKLIRYRPYFTLDEIIYYINNIKESWLCHPITLDKEDPVRKLIQHLTIKYTTQYRTEDYPWFGVDISPSLLLESSFGYKEIVVRIGGSLVHYWKDPDRDVWNKTEKFAKGIKGTPLFIENKDKNFMAVCSLETGGIAYWIRKNTAKDYQWKGPYLITDEDAVPIMLHQKENERYLLVCRTSEGLVCWKSVK
ncbi:glycosyltransferase family 2 protein [Bacillus sp. UNC41MFS5]|uniref:glycosyltransferase family 2 protein n=1 Tax=Bacillus sp. UNC41MFS5 TaxID=1449046 RepID=UPI0006916928|nr:glycosyltransferase family 2 protein [Bacillus sp. UNC41MFS5]